MQLRGKEGVWQTGYPPVSPVVDAWVKTGVRSTSSHLSHPLELAESDEADSLRRPALQPAAGVPHNPDLNIETNPNGVRPARTSCLPARSSKLKADSALRAAQITRFQATVDSKGQRSSTSAAYLPPSVYTRSNLSILTSTRCSTILLGPSPPSAVGETQDGAQRCVGVELQQARDGQTFVARAKHDVILSLGAFGTPQLLLCSGIGAKDKLDAVGVESKLDLPGVGEGLKDHFLAGIFFRAKSGTSLEFLKSQLRTVRPSRPCLCLLLEKRS